MKKQKNIGKEVIETKGKHKMIGKEVIDTKENVYKIML